MKNLSPKATLSAVGISHEFVQGTEVIRVLRDVSLELAAGEFCMLKGESGSGKSTLLAILGGLLRPKSGQVRVLETDLWNLKEAQREQFRLKHFGFVFQGFHLFPALTATAQLEMVLRWGRGIHRREARRQSLELLNRLGLAQKSGERPQKLSGGEKQRVAIGRALIKQPTFCFADEPDQRARFRKRPRGDEDVSGHRPHRGNDGLGDHPRSKNDRLCRPGLGHQGRRIDDRKKTVAKQFDTI